MIHTSIKRMVSGAALATSLATSAGAAPSRRAATSSNPDISLVLDTALAVFSDDPSLQTGAHDPSTTGFNLQQLELSVGSNIDPYFRVDANLVFEPDGVEIEEAYGTTLDLPWGLQSRFGQFLTRFGRLNSTHLHAWAFVDQPLSIGRLFGSEGNRGIGAELSLLAPLPWFVELVASATQLSEGGSGLFHLLALKQFFPLSDDWSLLVGTSGAFARNLGGARTRLYGVDVFLKYRPLAGRGRSQVSLQSEWFHRQRELLEVPGDDTSGYTQLVYRFNQRWAVAGRHELGTASFEPEWLSSRQRFSANVSFWPSEFSRLRAQVSRDVSRGRPAAIAAFFTLEVVSGAHGSHTF